MKNACEYIHTTRNKQFAEFKCVSHVKSVNFSGIVSYRLLVNSEDVIRHELNDFENYTSLIVGYSIQSGPVFKSLKKLIINYEIK